MSAARVVRAIIRVVFFIVLMLKDGNLKAGGFQKLTLIKFAISACLSTIKNLILKSQYFLCFSFSLFGMRMD